MNAKEYLEEYKTLKGNAEEMQQTYDYLISKAEYRNSVIDGMPRSQSHENTQENILVQASVTKDKLDDLNLRAEKAKKDITSSILSLTNPRTIRIIMMADIDLLSWEEIHEQTNLSIQQLQKLRRDAYQDLVIPEEYKKSRPTRSYRANPQ